MATYKDAGVDIDAASEALRRMKPLISSTFTPNVVRDVGAFGGFFALDLSTWKHPVLVSSIDGVGSKVKVALRAGRHDTIGEDLVNHCINDIAVCGAEPLYFLDYFATGSLDPDVAESIMQGLTRACKASGVALIGGETAEMPGVYDRCDYDLAGTIVGIVERENIIDGRRIRSGDVLVGIPSSGLHTNGYTLARHVLHDNGTGFPKDGKPVELEGECIDDILLRVHRCYLSIIRDLREIAHAFVHVTGGGIEGNIRRILPKGRTISVRYDSWKRPPVFSLIQERGAVPEDDMRRTFNLGIGLVVVVAPSDVDQVMRVAALHEERPIKIGVVA